MIVIVNDNDGSDNCDYNFVTFNDFGVKNYQKVHNMIHYPRKKTFFCRRRSLMLIMMMVMMMEIAMMVIIQSSRHVCCAPVQLATFHPVPRVGFNATEKTQEGSDT